MMTSPEKSPNTKFLKIKHYKLKLNTINGLLRHIYVQQLMESNFTKNRKNFKRESSLNVGRSWSKTFQIRLGTG